MQILQLVREIKLLGDLHLEIPESAQIVYVQRAKIKVYSTCQSHSSHPLPTEILYELELHAF